MVNCNFISTSQLLHFIITLPCEFVLLLIDHVDDMDQNCQS